MLSGKECLMVWCLADDVEKIEILVGGLAI